MLYKIGHHNTDSPGFAWLQWSRCARVSRQKVASVFCLFAFFLFFSFLLFVTVGYSQSIQIQKEKKTLKNDKVHSFFLCISASYQQHTSIVRGTSLVINLPVKVYHSPRFHAHYTLTLNNSFVFFFPSRRWNEMSTLSREPHEIPFSSI